MSESAIKSVRRTFEILELFDECRTPLSAKDVSRKLGYPLTSTHELLKSMRDLGYADFRKDDWTYIPSLKLAHILDWLQDHLERDASLIECMNELNQETQETINLSQRFDNQVKIVYGFESGHAVGISVKVGVMMPTAKSLTGIASLASFSDAELKTFLQMKDNADADHELIHDVLDEIKARGAVCRCNVFVQGIGAICLPIVSAAQKKTLVVGVVGPSDRIQENERAYRQALRKVVRKYDINTVYKLRNPRK